MIYYIISLLGINSFQVAHWFAAIAITLILLDVFFSTDVLTLLGCIILADYLTGYIYEVIPIQWYILCWISMIMLSCGIYVFIWKAIIRVYINKTLLRNAIEEVSNQCIGDVGLFRIINGNEFVYWNGELWKVNYTQKQIFNDKEKVVITNSKNGIITIRKDS